MSSIISSLLSFSFFLQFLFWLYLIVHFGLSDFVPTLYYNIWLQGLLIQSFASSTGTKEK